MEILSVYDPCFREYGSIVDGYDFTEILKVLEECAPIPATIAYVAKEEKLMALPIAKTFSQNLFGGMPMQAGWVSGHNTKLNCLEYHRDSEYNMGATDFVLLLGKRAEIEEDGSYDTANVKAFHVPAGVLVEIHATTLHYCPLSADQEKGFCVLALMSDGSNTEKPDIVPVSTEDRLLWARNKWLMAHPETGEAAGGAFAGLKGINIDIAEY